MYNYITNHKKIYVFLRNYGTFNPLKQSNIQRKDDEYEKIFIRNTLHHYVRISMCTDQR